MRVARLAFTALLVLAVGGCGAQHATQAATRSRLPWPTCASGVAAAVVGPSGVGLYRIGTDRVAKRCAELRPATAGYLPWQVTLSAGTSPDVCVLWAAKATSPDLEYETKRDLVCYRGGDGVGQLVGGTGHPVAIALRADGKSLAWTDSHKDGYVMDIVTGDLGLDGVSHLVRIAPIDKAHLQDVLTRAALLAWAGDRALAVTEGSQDDEGSGLFLQALSPASERVGWLHGAHKVPEQPYPANNWPAYDNVVNADQTTALAVERTHCCGGPPPLTGARAVRIQIPSGNVVQVIALAGPGRDVTSVSGGPAGIVYSTEGAGGDAKFYIRLPRQPIGLPILGLPADTGHVVASG